MTLNIVKLNPSQELRLKKARADFLGKAEPLELDKKSGLLRQKIKEGRAVFLEPLFCVLPDDFTKEEVLSVTRFECYPMQKSEGIFFFPALLESGGRQFQAAIPCAFDFAITQNFDLQKIFAAAQSAAVQNISQAPKAAPQSDADKKNRSQDLVLAPTSFYFARAVITKNTWSLYDAAWKKLL